jgi:hypothetical protein
VLAELESGSRKIEARVCKERQVVTLTAFD